MAFSPPDKRPQTNLNSELWEQGLLDSLRERTPPQLTAMVCPGPATALLTGFSAVPSFLLWFLCRPFMLPLPPLKSHVPSTPLPPHHKVTKRLTAFLTKLPNPHPISRFYEEI